MGLQDITQAYAFLGCYIQRFSSTFGLNSSPTTLELTLVPGNPNSTHDANGVSTGGVAVTGFDIANANPGTMSGLMVGNFQYVGLIQSYEESFGADGHKYSVRMVDPRIILDGVHINLDGSNSWSSGYIYSTGLTNYFDMFYYYGSAGTADSNRNGTTFNKIVEFLESGGAVANAFGNRFTFEFSSGFLPLSVANSGGVPNWYRLDSSRITISELLDKVTSDFNKDYYVYLDWDIYQANPSGLQILKIQDIKRNDATDSTAITDIITTYQANQTLIDYKRGKELSDEPTQILLHGPPLTQWKIPTDNSDMKRFWGFYHKNGIPLVNNVTGYEGIVTLDHIVSSGIDSQISSTVFVSGYYYTKSPGATTYPPSITRVAYSDNIMGYYPSDTVLRAALYSQKSWETVLYAEQSSFAWEIGIRGYRFKPYDQFLLDITGIMSNSGANGELPIMTFLGSKLENRGSGITDRSPRDDMLVASIYDATREVAENYYGKSWYVNITPEYRIRPFNILSGSFDGSTLFQKMDFDVADSAWIDPAQAYPLNIDDHDDIKISSNSTFLTNDGKVKPFVSIPNYDDFQLGYAGFDDTLDYPINTSFIPPEQLMFTSNGNLILPISVSQYPNDPEWGVVTLSYPLEAWTEASGYNNQRAYYDFLRYMGYPHGFAVSGAMDKEETFEYGLNPPRVRVIEGSHTSPNTKGFCIPIRSNVEAFGPYIKTTPSGGKLTIIEDTSFAPWTYGSWGNFYQAGHDLVDASLGTSKVIDSANLNIAGLPVYNIGQSIGESANITSLGFQFGTDGFTTNYNIRTFANPPFKTSRLLQNKLNGIFLDSRTNAKDIVNIDIELLKEKQYETAIVTPNDVKKAGKNASGKDQKQVDSVDVLHVIVEDDPTIRIT